MSATKLSFVATFLREVIKFFDTAAVVAAAAAAATAASAATAAFATAAVN